MAIQKKTAFELCQNNPLIIPSSLFQLSDVKPLMFHRNAGIFYKDLQVDLVNIEFFTQGHCLVFICSGHETLFSHDNQSYQIDQNEMIFLPKDLHFISDYISKGNALKAYLFFFNDDIIVEFLSSRKVALTGNLSPLAGPHKLEVNEGVHTYLKALNESTKTMHNSLPLLRLKLLELLHLLDLNDHNNLLRRLLFQVHKNKSKRNIVRLMEKCHLTTLTSRDYATLSGRSLSTFNREFKLLYNTTPSKWLKDTRLEHAHHLLTSQLSAVTEVSLEIGYSNTSHFIKAFKAKFGVTPKQIRKPGV